MPTSAKKAVASKSQKNKAVNKSFVFVNNSCSPFSLIGKGKVIDVPANGKSRSMELSNEEVELLKKKITSFPAVNLIEEKDE